jgi:hypothetical protein
MSIKNTGVGKWLGQSLDRLETAHAELLTAEQTGHRWFKLASDRRFKITELQADNERLREAMEKIANDKMLDIITATDIAVQALEENDE